MPQARPAILDEVCAILREAEERPVQKFPVGGPDMPPKTDMYDWTTPSGEVPFVVAPSMWRYLESQGLDMRWYVAHRLISS